MSWHIVLAITTDFIGHVARYAPFSAYASYKNNAQIHIN